MPRVGPQEELKVVRVKKNKVVERPLSIRDYLTTEPKRRHTKTQQLRHVRRKFLIDNR